MAGTSYTRQSSLVDGDTITASLFNDEYNQLVNAFAYSPVGTTGHQHDGSAGEGGNIEIIGDQDFKNKIVVDSTNNRWSIFVEVGGTAVEQVRIEDGVVYPVTDSDVDLGTDAARFKAAYIDSITATTSLTLGTSITVSSILDEDDMASNSATALATQQSIKAYVDSQVTAQDLDLTDGTTSISIDLDSESLSVLGGTGIDSTASGNGVTLAIDSTVATLTGTQTLTNKTLTSPDVNTPDIDGGTIDGTVIGGTTAAAGSFTTVGATGNITVGGTVDGRDVAADGTKLDTVETNADVTDTANVTASGALMDSELTSIASVKALDQGVATTDSPSFVGLTASGEITANGGIALGDSDKATFGADDDLQIYHDGTNSYIDNSGSGSLIIQDTDGTGDIFIRPKSGQTAIAVYNDNTVQLAHSGDVKLSTTSTGIDVTGRAVVDGLTSSASIVGTSNSNSLGGTTFTSAISTVGLSSTAAISSTSNSNSLGGTNFTSNIDVTGTATMDGLTVDGIASVSAANPRLRLFESDTTDLNTQIENNQGIFSVQTLNDAVSSASKRFSIAHSTGDISFYEDTGTTAKFFWDASAESLGIGTSSPTTALDARGGVNSAHATFTGQASRGLVISTANTLSNDDGVVYNAQTAGSGKHIFQTAGTERMRITSDGEIRTSNAVIVGRIADRQAQAVGVTDATIVLAGNSNTSGAGEEIGKVAFYTQDASGAGHNLAATVKALTNSEIGANADLVFSTKQGAGEGAEALESMRIDSSGDMIMKGGRIKVRENDDGNDAVVITRDADEGYVNLYSAGSQTIEIRGNGNSYFNGGNVGIGTSSPTQKITIADDYPYIHFNNTSNVNQSFIGWNSGLGVMSLGTATAIPLIFDTDNTERMRIDSSGNVGIGTSAPFSGIDLRGTSATAGNTIQIVGNFVSSLLLGQDADGGVIRGQGGNNALKFYTGGTGDSAANASGSERMRIDSSGNVGIGVTNPSAYYAESLVIGAADEGGITIECGTSEKAYMMFADGTSGSQAYRGYLGYDHNLDSLNISTFGYMNFFTGDDDVNTERMRIDASGNLLVGKTLATGQSTVGIEARGDGVLIATKAGTVQYLNRTGSDGTILNFAKEGTTVGSIGTYFGDLFIASPSSTDAGLGFGSSKITPVTTTGAPRDNAIDLGASAARFKDLYLSGGVYLGGTGAANKLDDYEEGTWTPTLGGGATATNMSGKYTKVGRLVTVFLTLENSTISGTPDYIVSGLPFTNGSERAPLSVTYLSTFDAPCETLAGFITGNGSNMEFLGLIQGGTWIAANLTAGSGKYAYAVASYQTA